ncbi:MAG TPA: hypothetical protein VF398_12620 [bacterium]|jgi:hypothetical protein
MHDRLKSVKISRNIRNVSLCLSLIFLLEFIFLFNSWLLQGHRFLIQALVFLILGAATGLMALYFHRRFQSRD